MSVHLHTGDCLDVLATLDADSIDADVCDPPYGLSFMSASWDHEVPGPDHWRAALRVLKPGAHLLAFGGTRTFHRLTCAIEDAGFEIRDCLQWLYGQGFPKSHNGPWGGTALKPAWEPIILARKPLGGTVASNHAAFGAGGLNIDACRIATDWSDRSEAWKRSGHSAKPDAEKIAAPPGTGINCHPAGRWPANVLLDSDAARMLDEHSGELASGFMAAGTKRNGLGYEGAAGDTVRSSTIADRGGASRFFYCGKATRVERGDGNDHPTVKPVELMRYLVRLITPIGGTVLDQYMGSGSTGVAAVAEGRSFVGIDLDPSHVETARRRIESKAPLFALEAAE